jgi:hypothetical protein
MAQAKVSMVRVGKKNKTAIYVQSASGNVYRLHPQTVREQAKCGRSIDQIIAHITNRATINTKFYTKVRG